MHWHLGIIDTELPIFWSVTFHLERKAALHQLQNKIDLFQTNTSSNWFCLPIKALQLPKKLHPSNIVCFIEPDGKTSRPFSLTSWKMSQWYVPLCTNLFCRRGYYLLNFVLCIVILNLFCYTHILGHIVRHTISCAITVPAATSRKFCHVFIVEKKRVHSIFFRWKTK